MPFPTVHGKSFEDDFLVIKGEIMGALDFLPPARRDAIEAAFDGLFQMFNVVGTQVYDDVQQLKQSANEHGWPIEVEDPSQTPIP